ncbi:siderophore-interacting protein [Streptosporangium sp. NPDC023615]|uniref:siderophore-interacting protein n=1 Tax=Streptosporangium sp. NPDC023615 TaxID=3154794 RepID=UPI00343F885D
MNERTAPRRRSSRSPFTNVFARFYATGTVSDVAMVTPTMRRIRIVADQPLLTAYSPGQHLRVQIGDPMSLYGLLRPVETLRAYSIWDFSAAERAIDLCVHLYDHFHRHLRGHLDGAGGDGIGLSWARTVEVGDVVTFWGPQGDFVLQPAPYHLFVGEESATCAFGPMIRAAGPDARVFGVLESESAADELEIPGPHRLHRVHRDGASAVASRTLLRGVADLDLPGRHGVAYLAGEARTLQLVRDFLVHERGWPQTAIRTKPFWTPGRRGLH